MDWVCVSARGSPPACSPVGPVLSLPRRSSQDEPLGSWHLTLLCPWPLSAHPSGKAFHSWHCYKEEAFSNPQQLSCWPKMLWICNSCLRRSFGAQEIKGWLKAFYLTQFVSTVSPLRRGLWPLHKTECPSAFSLTVRNATTNRALQIPLQVPFPTILISACSPAAQTRCKINLSLIYGGK